MKLHKRFARWILRNDLKEYALYGRGISKQLVENENIHEGHFAQVNRQEAAMYIALSLMESKAFQQTRRELKGKIHHGVKIVILHENETA